MDPSSLTKVRISQSALCAFASAFMLVTLAFCVKCRRTLECTLHSVNMNGNFQDFLSKFTYFGKNQGECSKFTVLKLCRVNDMVNKIYFD